MGTDPKQPSESPEQSATPAQTDVPPTDTAPPPETDLNGVEEKKPAKRPIKIGSQRVGFKPIRQHDGIREKWSGVKPQESTPAAAASPAPDTPPLAPVAVQPPRPAPTEPGPAPTATEPVAPPTAQPTAPEPTAVEPTAAEPPGERITPSPVVSTPPPAPVEPPTSPAPIQSPPLADIDVPVARLSTAPPQRIPRVSEDLQAEIDAALDDTSLNGDAYEDLLMAQGSAVAVEPDLETETRRTGTVVKIHEDNVFFALGVRHEGVASLRQFAEAPEVGAQLQVVVNRFNREDGLYEVNVPGASMRVEDWSDVDEGIVVEANVTGHNSGGLECMVGHIRGFIPASQISVVRVEDFEEYKDQKLKCVVTEANPQRRNLVLSHRAMLEREREEAKQKLWEELEPGQIREGVVRRIQDFGAFVDIGGVDGLIHISKLSWERVEHPSEVLEEGQTVSVQIDQVDREAERIALSYRDTTESPWTDVDAKYPVNAIVKGTVSRLMQFGAFVKLEPGVEGLVHISEIAHHRVTRIDSILKEGDEIQVKVLSVDPDSQRISLSFKQANALAEPAGEGDSDEDDASDEIRERAVPRRTTPLKGGTNRPSGGEDFGLKW